MDAYAVLGLRPGATQEQIKVRYRELARQWHPDRVDPQGRAGAEKMMQKINRAYEELQQPSYTRPSNEQYHQSTSSDPFGFANQREWENIKQTFEKAFNNAHPRRHTCPMCNGRGWISA